MGVRLRPVNIKSIVHFNGNILGIVHSATVSLIVVPRNRLDPTHKNATQCSLEGIDISCHFLL